jgi:hypothetical protein
MMLACRLEIEEDIAAVVTIRPGRYKVRWNNGKIEDNVIINDGAVYTWEDVAEIIHEYKEEEKSIPINLHEHITTIIKTWIKEDYHHADLQTKRAMGLSILMLDHELWHDAWLEYCADCHRVHHDYDNYSPTEQHLRACTDCEAAVEILDDLKGK